MITCYINYPHSRISIHNDLSCGVIYQGRKLDQRHARIDLNSIGCELARFNKEYVFGSTSENNDMWIVVDFSDHQFELEVIAYIKRILGKRYKPFRDANLEVHCTP